MNDAYETPRDPTPVGVYILDREECVTKLLRKKDGEPYVAFAFLLELLGRTEVDGLVAWLDVRVTVPGGGVREVQVPVSGIDGTTSSAKAALNAIGEPLDDFHKKFVIRWLTEASRTHRAPTVQALSKPTWKDDRLLVPGMNAAAAPGALSLRTKGAEEEARVVWQEIVRAGAKYPKLGLLIGAAVTSLLLVRLRVLGSVFHSTGDSTKFKTKGAEIAISTIGDPFHPSLRGNWDTTSTAAASRFSQQGSLPVLFDETQTASRDREKTFRAVVFMVHDGHGRSRGTRDGGSRTDDSFRLNLLSTGEESLVDGGMTGGYARVHELRFPITDDPDEIAKLDRLHGLAVDYAGWPLRWLLDSDPPTKADLEVPVFESSLARRHAEAIAAAALGFNWLARAVGLDDAHLDLAEVVQDITQDVSGKSAGERMREALWQDYVARGSSYYGPTRFDGGDVLMNRDARGKTFEGQVAYFPETVKEIAEREGVGVLTAMRSLRDSGVLDTDKSGKNLAKVVKVDGKATRMYVLNNPVEVTTSSSLKVVTDDVSPMAAVPQVPEQTAESLLVTTP